MLEGNFMGTLKKGGGDLSEFKIIKLATKPKEKIVDF